jgi:hypothetical protein
MLHVSGQSSGQTHLIARVVFVAVDTVEALQDKADQVGSFYDTAAGAPRGSGGMEIWMEFLRRLSCWLSVFSG